MKFPFAAVELDSGGSVHDPAQLDAARAVVDGVDDVLVLVHGWNNDMPAALRLYEKLTDNVDAVRGQVSGAAGRKIAVIGVLWPSVKWADEDDLAGGGAGAADAKDALIAEIGDRDLDPSVAAQLQQLVPELDTSATARRKYLDLLRAQLPSEIEGGEDAPPPSFLEGDADTAFERAGRAGALTGQDAREAAVPLDSRWAASHGPHATSSTSPHYTMRDRAGTVGANGIAPFSLERAAR